MVRVILVKVRMCKMMNILLYNNRQRCKVVLRHPVPQFHLLVKVYLKTFLTTNAHHLKMLTSLCSKWTSSLWAGPEQYLANFLYCQMLKQLMWQHNLQQRKNNKLNYYNNNYYSSNRKGSELQNYNLLICPLIVVLHQFPVLNLTLVLVYLCSNNSSSSSSNQRSKYKVASRFWSQLRPVLDQMAQHCHHHLSNLRNLPHLVENTRSQTISFLK